MIASLGIGNPAILVKNPLYIAQWIMDTLSVFVEPVYIMVIMITKTG